MKRRTFMQLLGLTAAAPTAILAKTDKPATKISSHDNSVYVKATNARRNAYDQYVLTHKHKLGDTIRIRKSTKYTPFENARLDYDEVVIDNTNMLEMINKFYNENRKLRIAPNG